MRTAPAPAGSGSRTVFFRPGRAKARVKAAEGRIRPVHGLFCGPDKARITPDPALRDRETHGNVCTRRKKSRKP